jgi:hypothetical protein
MKVVGKKKSRGRSADEKIGFYSKPWPGLALLWLISDENELLMNC